MVCEWFIMSHKRLVVHVAKDGKAKAMKGNKMESGELTMRYRPVMCMRSSDVVVEAPTQRLFMRLG